MNSSFGTDLDAAYGLLSETDSGGGTGSVVAKKTQAVAQQPQQILPVSSAPQNGAPPSSRQAATATAPGLTYDANYFNQQFNAENAMKQQIMQQYAKTLQQHQAATAAAGQGRVISQHEDDSPSYLDRLLSKKRDLLKIIMFAMMILLAISLHTFVDFWLKDLVSAHELTYKQELGVRLLYPLAVLIVLWNVKTNMSSR